MPTWIDLSIPIGLLAMPMLKMLIDLVEATDDLIKDFKKKKAAYK